MRVDSLLLVDFHHPHTFTDFGEDAERWKDIAGGNRRTLFFSLFGSFRLRNPTSKSSFDSASRRAHRARESLRWGVSLQTTACHWRPWCIAAVQLAAGKALTSHLETRIERINLGKRRRFEWIAAKASRIFRHTVISCFKLLYHVLLYFGYKKRFDFRLMVGVVQPHFFAMLTRYSKKTKNNEEIFDLASKSRSTSQDDPWNLISINIGWQDPRLCRSFFLLGFIVGKLQESRSTNNF